MNTRKRTGLEIFIVASLVGLVAVFSLSCRADPEAHSSNLDSNNGDNIMEAKQVQASASPSPAADFDIHSKVGIADVRSDRTGCLRTKNGNLVEKTPVSVIVSDNEPPQWILNAIVQKKLGESCARPSSESGDENPGNNYFYSLTLTGDAVEKIQGFDIGIAVIQPERPIEIRDGLAVGDLNDDGKPEYFRNCSGYEGTHFTIWSGKPLSGERIWHSFYYVDYATVPDCSDEEWEESEN